MESSPSLSQLSKPRERRLSSPQSLAIKRAVAASGLLRTLPPEEEANLSPLTGKEVARQVAKLEAEIYQIEKELVRASRESRELSKAEDRFCREMRLRKWQARLQSPPQEKVPSPCLIMFESQECDSPFQFEQLDECAGLRGQNSPSSACAELGDVCECPGSSSPNAFQPVLMPVADEPVETIETTESDAEDIQEEHAGIRSGTISESLSQEDQPYKLRILNPRVKKPAPPSQGGSSPKAPANPPIKALLQQALAPDEEIEQTPMKADGDKQNNHKLTVLHNRGSLCSTSTEATPCKLQVLSESPSDLTLSESSMSAYELGSSEPPQVSSLRQKSNSFDIKSQSPLFQSMGALPSSQAQGRRQSSNYETQKVRQSNNLRMLQTINEEEEKVQEESSETDKSALKYRLALLFVQSNCSIKPRQRGKTRLLYPIPECDEYSPPFVQIGRVSTRLHKEVIKRCSKAILRKKGDRLKQQQSLLIAQESLRKRAKLLS